MYLVLIQTVFKAVFLALLLSVIGNAKDIPISNSTTIYVPLKQFSVIAFPFKITGKKPSPFYTTVKIKSDQKKIDNNSTIAIPSMSKPLIASRFKDKKNKKSELKKSKSAPITIDVGNNNIQLYPLTTGHIEFIVWGYEKYPILLKIIVDPELGENYYNFIDYDEKPKSAKKFESDSHEKIISKLTKALFNRKEPKGYKKESFYSKFTSGDFEFVLVQGFYGKRYIGEEWIVTNLADKTKQYAKLYPEMFFNDEIYSVSFENDILMKGESTRMFMIRKYTKNKKR